MIASVAECNDYLDGRHYLGPTKTAKFGWKDEMGVMLFSSPRSRRLPPDWLELVRWCLSGEPNAGSMQWSRFVKWARQHSEATTIISYSDPSQGHTGALYRACNWWWAPTWHRLRPPPSGNGSWTDGRVQSTKDRWVFALQKDERRKALLGVNDTSVVKKFPWAVYSDRGGVDYRQFKPRPAFMPQDVLDLVG